MKTFTVLTVSKRTGWEGDAEKCIREQTIQPNKWIVVTEDKYSHSALQTAKHIYAPPKTKLSNLNASLNSGLRLIDTDYVIFYQDFIELAPDCFEKLLAIANERTFVATCTPNYDGSDDGRFSAAALPHSCKPSHWETNVAIAPMQAIRELGGFDEEYDWGWAWDNVNIAERAAMLGYKFKMDETNRPKLYPHEMSSHETLPLNLSRHTRTMRDIRNGNRPIKNIYL